MSSATATAASPRTTKTAGVARGLGDAELGRRGGRGVGSSDREGSAARASGCSSTVCVAAEAAGPCAWVTLVCATVGAGRPATRAPSSARAARRP